MVGADPVSDAFLGKEASEQQVKSINSSDRKVIAFATYAMVPGDLDGRNQAAFSFEFL